MRRCDCVNYENFRNKSVKVPTQSKEKRDFFLLFSSSFGIENLLLARKKTVTFVLKTRYRDLLSSSFKFRSWNVSFGAKQRQRNQRRIETVEERVT